ncbi:helix-turn-helix domain-containing protein [Streptococcus cuniculipharyngis]|uniref:helix-turn-helix domain-containing protein n=1 Tax=Streptococcus cuniculipharyngis TaxID=1562651 RepID=UPI0016447311|nr:helix-turn-helix transcriptional regulator [Streptococcus cuniculipharyngis]
MDKKSYHIFGIAFKELREARGLSLKAAARDIVTPQFLSQFEKGQKSITLDKFSRLLISIGADWVDFLDFYQGERLDSYFSIWTELADSGVHFEQFVPAAVEKLKDYYLDNPEYKKQVLFAMANLASYRQGIADKTYQTQLIHHLKRVNHFNLLEVDLFNMLMQELPFTLVEKIEAYHLKTYRESTDYNSLTNAHNGLLFIIGYYSEKGYYHRADQLIAEIKKGRSFNTFRMSYDMAMLEREEAAHLLRQNKKEGLVKARRVIEFFKLMKAFDPTNEYYIEALPQFIAAINKLNQTGELLFPIDESFLDS